MTPGIRNTATIGAMVQVIFDNEGLKKHACIAELEGGAYNGYEGWGNLQPEIVLSIAEQLVVADIIRLRAVCVSWAWALGKSPSKHPLPPPPHATNLSFFRPSPWLLLPNSGAHEGSNDYTFFSIIEDRCYRISSLPQITGRNLLGTSQHGWIVTIDDLLTPRFLNPLTMQELSLPSLVTIPILFEPDRSPVDRSLRGFWYNHINSFYYSRERFLDFVELYIKKIILTSSPKQGSIAVVLCTIDISQSCLSFARVGGEAWSSYLKLPPNVDHFEDVIFNEESGKLYALSNLGVVFILECRNRSIEIISMVSRRINENRSIHMKRYIFFSCGDLMMVTWNLRTMSTRVFPFLTDDFDAPIFKICRFNLDCYNRHDPKISNIHAIVANTEICPYDSCWVPVNNLEARSLFIGSNSCFILDCAVEHRRNKVFFVYDAMPWLTRIMCDHGTFDLANSEVERLLDPLYNLPAKPLPIWYIPTPTLWD